VELIVGAVVGAALAAIAMWAIGRRRSRSGVRYFGTGRRPWSNWPERPSEDEREQMLLRQDPLVVVDRSPLVHVLGIGQSQSAGGTTVECVSIEVREAGCRGLLRTLAPGGGLYGPWSSDTAAISRVPSVDDDLGTSYTVTMPTWTGSDRAAELLFRFAPPPPATARVLVIHAPKVAPFALPTVERPGESWTFEIPMS
jgi:hypothetical protein